MVWQVPFRFGTDVCEGQGWGGAVSAMTQRRGQCGQVCSIFPVNTKGEAEKGSNSYTESLCV